MEQKLDNYTKSIHRLGRWGAVVALCIMLGIPLVVCAVYDCFPPLAQILQVGGGLLIMFIPISASEVFSYAAVLGSGSYITFITGNVSNLKFPAALNALQIANVEQSTDKGDAIINVAVGVSSIVTMVVLFFGVLLIVPLQPILDTPVIGIATKYILSALLGGMLVGTLNKHSGKYTITNKAVLLIPIIIVVTAAILLGFPVSTYQGVLVIAMIPVTVLVARFLYKQRYIKIYVKGNPEPEDPDAVKKSA